MEFHAQHHIQMSGLEISPLESRRQVVPWLPVQPALSSRVPRVQLLKNDACWSWPLTSMCTCSHMCPQECRLTGTRTCVEKERRDQFQLTVFYESLVRRKSDWLNTGFLGQTKRRLVILRFRMPFFTQQGTVGRVVSAGGGFRTLRVMCSVWVHLWFSVWETRPVSLVR